MKHTLLFIALLFLVFFSCKRNEDYCSKSMAITYKYLTAGSLERTKYFTDPSFDTIKFKSSKGDTLIFVKKNTDTTWYDDFHTYGVPGCGPYLDEKNQEITNTYETIKGEGVFKVKHSLRTRLDRVSNVHDFIIDIQFSNNH
ncbi:MAG: hypothetical protein SGJ00_14415, partial [bacterium]|nr:hypothetical protein [bacterium]